MSEWPEIEELMPAKRAIGSAAELEAVYELPAAPHLRLDFVASLDGAVEVAGRSRPLGGPADRAAFMAMRAVSDAIMVGAGTARAENYGPTALPVQVEQRRKQRGQDNPQPLVVVTGTGNLDPAARLFSGDNDVIILTTEAAAAVAPSFSHRTELLVCGAEEIDVASAMDALYGRGLLRILCEGGPTLARSLMLAGVVDELCLTISPLFVGSEQRRLSGDGPPAYAARFELNGVLHGDGMLLGRYQVEGAGRP